MNNEVHTVPWLQRRRQNITTIREVGIFHRVEGLVYLPVMPCIWNSGRFGSKTHVFLIGESKIIYRQRYCCLSYRFISWWWRIQFFSCSCMWGNCSEWVFLCSAASRSSVPPPQSCSDVPRVCLMFKRAALSFSCWLQTTLTSVAYRIWKPKYKLIMKIDAMTCGNAWVIILAKERILIKVENRHVIFTVLLCCWKRSFTSTLHTLRFYVGLWQQWLKRTYKSYESSCNWELL
jgi:hypothetical protein